MKKYEIYIGLKDRDTYEEKLTPEMFAKELYMHCSKKKVCFTLIKQLGGYSHNKGYVTETSLRITIIGISENELNNLCLSLKKSVNTDTIMVTKENSFCYYA